MLSSLVFEGPAHWVGAYARPDAWQCQARTSIFWLLALAVSVVVIRIFTLWKLVIKLANLQESGGGIRQCMPINCQVNDQFSSVAQSCPTLCDPMNCSTLGLPVHHQLPEFTQTHVHWVGDAIQPSHLLSSPSPPALNLSQNQGLFKWVSPSHQVAKVLEFQLQHQSFQWTPRTHPL